MKLVTNDSPCASVLALARRACHWQMAGFGCSSVPFTMLVTLSLAMAVSRLTEHAVVHLGVYNAQQVCLTGACPGAYPTGTAPSYFKLSESIHCPWHSMHGRGPFILSASAEHLQPEYLLACSHFKFDGRTISVLGLVVLCLQLSPVVATDALRVFVKLNDFFTTSSGNVIVDSTHALVNQRDEPVFMVGKRSMFPKSKECIKNKEISGTPPTTHSLEPLSVREGVHHYGMCSRCYPSFRCTQYTSAFVIHH